MHNLVSSGGGDGAEVAIFDLDFCFPLLCGAHTHTHTHTSCPSQLTHQTHITTLLRELTEETGSRGVLPGPSV